MNDSYLLSTTYYFPEIVNRGNSDFLLELKSNTLPIFSNRLFSASLRAQELILTLGIDTPDNLDTFYEELSDAVNEIKANHKIVGVAISSPGAVNKATGVIEGASALPYIHNFKIVPELEKRFGLPVSIENDANCAAMAEVTFGNGRGCKNLAFVVCGTGIGGAVVIDGKICHGSHLYGGEFGCMVNCGENIRLAWLKDVVDLALQNHIPYSLWEYNAQFGFANRWKKGEITDQALMDVLRR